MTAVNYRGFLGCLRSNLRAITGAPSTLQQIADLGFLVPQLAPYNCKADGSTDDTVGLNQCFEDGRATRTPVFLKGNFGVTDIVRAYSYDEWGGPTKDHGVPNDLAHCWIGSYDPLAGPPTFTLLDGANAGYTSTAGGNTDGRPVVSIRKFEGVGLLADAAVPHPLPTTALGLPPQHPTQGPSWDGAANTRYDDVHRNFIVDTRGYPNAVGVYAPGAQGAMMDKIKVIASGVKGDSICCFWGAPGRNTGAHNLEAVGGQYAYRIVAGSSSGEGMAGVTLSGCKASGQTVRVFDYVDDVPLNVLGGDFDCGAHSLIVLPANSSTAGNMFTMIDAHVKCNAGVRAIDNLQGKTLHLENVFIEGTTVLVRTPAGTTPGAGAVSRIDKFHYTDQGGGSDPAPSPYALNTAGVFKSYNIINSGAPNTAATPVTNLITTGLIASDIPADIRTRHVIEAQFIDDGKPYENVDDYGAVSAPEAAFIANGSDSIYSSNYHVTTADSLAAYNAAIAAAVSKGHKRVWNGRGLRFTSANVSKPPDVHIFGCGRQVSNLAQHSTWHPTSEVYLGSSQSSLTGRGGWAYMSLIPWRTGGSGNSSTAYTWDWMGGLKIEEAKGYTIGIDFDNWWSGLTGQPTNPRRNLLVTGNGGGHHIGWAEGGAHGVTGHPDYRIVLVDGTSQPGWIIGLNAEGTKDIGSPNLMDANVEFRNCANWRMLGPKREGDGATAWINGSTNIGVYGSGAMEYKANYFRIFGASDGIRLACIASRRNKEADTGLNYTVKDETTGTTRQIMWPRQCGLYEKGTLDHSAMTIA